MGVHLIPLTYRHHIKELFSQRHQDHKEFIKASEQLSFRFILLCVLCDLMRELKILGFSFLPDYDHVPGWKQLVNTVATIFITNLKKRQRQKFYQLSKTTTLCPLCPHPHRLIS